MSISSTVIHVNTQEALASVAVTGKEFGEFKQLIARAVNTWDNAPDWVHKINSELQQIPEALNAREERK